MEFKKPIEEIIRKRYSTRTFSDKPLTKKDSQKIKQVLKTRRGPFGNEVRFEFIDQQNTLNYEKSRIGTYGMVKGARNFIIGIIHKENLNLMDFGYIFESIILKATEYNFGTIWLARAFKLDEITNLIKIKNDEIIPAISPIGYIANKKSIREKLIEIGISSRKRNPWETIFYLNEFDNPLTKDYSKEYQIPLEMIRLAPSGRNLQPWRIVKIDNEFHFYIKENSLKSMSHIPFIDIGIAMCHFEYTAKELNLKGKWIMNNPDLKSQAKNIQYIISWKAE